MVVTRSGRQSSAFDLVVMIASLGGLESVATVLRGLPADFPVPVVVLLHGPAMGPSVSDPAALLLQRRTAIPVRTGREGSRLAAPGVTVIPRGWTADFGVGYRLQLAPAGRGGGGDALLRAAADAAGPRLLGVVLTGLLSDGTEGVRAVKRAGGRVLVEDPRTARAPGMPSSAIATGCVDFALPNTRLAAGLVALALAPGGAEMFSVPVPAWATMGA